MREWPLVDRVADPDGGWGVAPGALATVAGPGGTPTYGQAPGGPGEHVVQVPWSAPQGSRVVVRVADRVGRVGESAAAIPTTGHGRRVRRTGGLGPQGRRLGAVGQVGGDEDVREHGALGRSVVGLVMLRIAILDSYMNSSTSFRRCSLLTLTG